LIGFKTAASSAEPAYDSIKQSTTLPSWMTSTLSFWYRLLTESNVSGGFFDAFVTPTGSDPITVAHDGWDDPLLFDKDLDWKNVTYQLNGLEGKDIEIEFKVTQPYEGYKTWGYLDDVKVCAATNSAATTTDFSFSSHDGSGSDNSTTYYSTDNWSTSNTYSGTFSLPVGDNLLEYFSEDEVGNSETPKEINLTVQADPVDFYLQKNKAAVGFKVEDVGQFNQLNYEISYKTNGVSQGIVGTIKIEGQNEITKEGFTLGTCSSGGTCVYHSGIKEIKLKITLTDQNNNQKILEKMINYE